MSEIICKGCGGIMDTTGIPPFTVCECSACQTEVAIPFELDYLMLEKYVDRISALDVYEGFDTSITTISRIVVLDNDVPQAKEFLEIAKEEGELLSTLKHPNICPLMARDLILGNYCAVQPLLDGYLLSDYNPETQGLLDVEKVLDVLHAAALGLAVAHHKDITHHNVCPKNISIDARGNVRVVDYFLSRFVYQADQITAKGNDVIKYDPSVDPYFISPEKAESGIEDKRGDVFSFGVTMYYMLTGQYPFVGSNVLETVYSRVRKIKKRDEVFNAAATSVITPDTVAYTPPKNPKKLREDIPKEIADLVMDCLSYLPVKRPTLSEIITIFNLYKAEMAKQETVVAAQIEMVTTKTRAIPKMGKLGKK